MNTRIKKLFKKYPNLTESETQELINMAQSICDEIYKVKRGIDFDTIYYNDDIKGPDTSCVAIVKIEDVSNSEMHFKCTCDDSYIDDIYLSEDILTDKTNIKKLLKKRILNCCDFLEEEIQDKKREIAKDERMIKFGKEYCKNIKK